ncbi:hypothetical protein Tco_0012084 [Tanacetum coccineum]
MTWGWRKILQLRPIIHAFIWFRIGDGMNASAWYDQWSHVGPLSSIVTTRDMFRDGFNLETKVEELICNGRWTCRRRSAESSKVSLSRLRSDAVTRTPSLDHPDGVTRNSDAREMAVLLGQVYDRNWLALSTENPTKKGGGRCKLIFFDPLAPDLLKVLWLETNHGLVGELEWLKKKEYAKLEAKFLRDVDSKGDLNKTVSE